jgi:hypothetical protein
MKLLISFVPPTLASLFLWLIMVRMPQGSTAVGTHTLLVATVAFIAAALTQLKGWYYHLVPSYLALCSSCIVYLVVDQPGGPKRPLVRWVAWALPLLFVVIGIGRASYFQRTTVSDWDIAKVISSGRTETFLAITSSLWGVFPAVNEMGVQWASGSDVQWLVPAAVKLSTGTSQQREQADKLRWISSSRLVADLKRWKPDTVAVKVGPDQALSPPVDWLSFFGRDKDFADVWSKYCAEGRTGDWDVYRRCLSFE